jgi:hypothetical protein
LVSLPNKKITYYQANYTNYDKYAKYAKYAECTKTF